MLEQLKEKAKNNFFTVHLKKGVEQAEDWKKKNNL